MLTMRYGTPGLHFYYENRDKAISITNHPLGGPKIELSGPRPRPEKEIPGFEDLDLSEESVQIRIGNWLQKYQRIVLSLNEASGPRIRLADEMGVTRVSMDLRAAKHSPALRLHDKDGKVLWQAPQD